MHTSGVQQSYDHQKDLRSSPSDADWSTLPSPKRRNVYQTTSRNRSSSRSTKVSALFRLPNRIFEQAKSRNPTEWQTDNQVLPTKQRCRLKDLSKSTPENQSFERSLPTKMKITLFTPTPMASAVKTNSVKSAEGPRTGNFNKPSRDTLLSATESTDFLPGLGTRAHTTTFADETLSHVVTDEKVHQHSKLLTASRTTTTAHQSHHCSTCSSIRSIRTLVKPFVSPPPGLRFSTAM